MIDNCNFNGGPHNISADYNMAKDILKKYNQEHLLMFYDELEPFQQEALVNQIFSIDFEQIFKLYEASKIDEVIPNSEISPLEYTVKSQLPKDKLDFYINIGEGAIVKKKCGVVTLAGGQGTRLGCKGPKGTFELDVFPKKSLFEIFCDNLKRVHDRYRCFSSLVYYDKCLQ